MTILKFLKWSLARSLQAQEAIFEGILSPFHRNILWDTGGTLSGKEAQKTTISVKRRFRLSC